MQSSPTRRSVRSDSNAKAFVLGMVFLNALGTGLLIPVLPRLVQELTGRDPEAASLENGLLLAAYAVMAFLLSPFLGSLADRWGRRPILLLAALGTLLDYALCAWANSFGVLLLARMLAGAFGASTSVANAALVDLTPSEHRARIFGLSSAVMGLGLILGPVIGGIFMTFGLRMPFIAACVLAACEFCFGLFWFPETLRTPSRRPLSIADANPLTSIQRLRALPFSNSLLVGLVFFQLGGSITQSVLVLFAQARFAWSGLQVGVLMTTLACTSVVIRYGGVRFALAVLGEYMSVVVGLVVFAIGTLALAFVETGWQLYAALIFGQCGTVAAPVILGLLSRGVAPQMQGEAMGAISSLAAVAVMVAPLLGALAFGGFGGAAVGHDGKWVFLLSGVILLTAASAVAWGGAARARESLPVSQPAEGDHELD